MKNPVEEHTALEQQITEIMEQGNRLQDEGRLAEALVCYE